MHKLAELYYSIHNVLFLQLKYIDGLAPLALRLYLVPVFWVAGTTKLASIEKTIIWFGNPDWGLGLPFPALMVYLAAYTEVIGAILLALGLATRLISIPLMVTMVVAITAVHWDYGWAAIADSSVQEVAVRLDRAREILQENSDYGWLTAKGGFVILNNGIEFATTYLVMLLALLCTGGGRFVSMDYWLTEWFEGNSLNPRRDELNPH
jgi:putative oxidoreductase